MLEIDKELYLPSLFNTNNIYIQGASLDNATITGHDIDIGNSYLINCTIRYTGNCYMMGTFLSNIRFEQINPDDPAHPVITLVGGNDAS